MYYDHLGNKYPTLKHLCDAYNIEVSAFRYRRNKGWPIKDCIYGRPELTIQNSGLKLDDRQYYNTKAALDKLGIAQSTYHNRIARGWSQDEALGLKKHKYKSECKDHLGNTYKNMKELADAYNINREVLRTRLKKLNWDMEKALTTPVGKNIQDVPKEERTFNGKTYKSIIDMCNHLNIKYPNYVAMKNRTGMSKDEVLEYMLDENYGNSEFTDPIGIKHKNNSHMYKFYKITDSVFRRHKDTNMLKACGLYKWQKIKNIEIKAVNYTNDPKTTYFKCKINNKDIIMTQYDIIQYVQDNNITNL